MIKDPKWYYRYDTKHSPETNLLDFYECLRFYEDQLKETYSDKAIKEEFLKPKIKTFIEEFKSVNFV